MHKRKKLSKKKWKKPKKKRKIKKESELDMPKALDVVPKVVFNQLLTGDETDLHLGEIIDWGNIATSS